MSIARHRIKYRRSQKGLLNRIYNDQKSRCKRKGWPPPAYKFEEFRIHFMYHVPFLRIFIKWVCSNYEKDLRPSIDRIDCFKPYELSNLQVMTWKENRHKSIMEQKRYKLRKRKETKENNET